jgi:TPP-dependent pyruvate/acetoin dehydrogenase alpha subunit
MFREEELDTIDREVDAELRDAIEYARKSPFPEPEDALEDVYTD